MLAILSGFILGVITIGKFSVFTSVSVKLFALTTLFCAIAQLLLARFWSHSAAKGLVVNIESNASTNHPAAYSKQHLARLVSLAGFISAFLFGAAWVQTHMDARLASWNFQKQTIAAEVKIQGISQSVGTRFRQVVVFEPTTEQSKRFEQSGQALPKKWLIKAHPFKANDGLSDVLNTMRPDERWRITAELAPPHGVAAAGVFAESRWYLQLGVGATARVIDAEKITPASKKSWTGRLAAHRLRVRERINGLATNSKHAQHKYTQDKAVLLGLLTGDRSLITADTKLLYQHLGISHLLAISGPHVLFAASVTAFLFIKLLNLFSISYKLLPRRTWVLPLSLLVALAYALLAGWDIPAQRTVLMFAMTTLVLLSGRRFSFWLTLLGSANIILLLDPLAVLSAGFWLSFLAVGILLTLGKSPLLAPRQSLSAGALNMSGLPDAEDSRLARWWQYFRSFALLQVLFFMAILPISIVFFGKVSSLTILANLFAIPFLGMVVVPLNILAYLLDLIWSGLADVVWHALLWLLHQFHALMMWLQALSPDALIGFKLDKTNLWVCAFLGLLWLLPFGKWRMLSLPLILLFFYPRQLLAPVVMTVLDGTENTAILLQVKDGRRTKNLLYLSDIYAKKDNSYELENVILPNLIQQQVGKIDLLILSLSSDAPSDHDIATIRRLQDKFGIEQLMSNADFASMSRAELAGIHLSKCASNSFAWGKASFRLLSPWQDVPTAGDEAACVLNMSLKRGAGHAKSSSVLSSLLIMGNGTALTEDMLLNLCEDVAADVLVLAGQGDEDANQLAFIEAVAPKRATAAPRHDSFKGLPQLVARANVFKTGAALDVAYEQGNMTYYFGLQNNESSPVVFYRDLAPWFRVK